MPRLHLGTSGLINIGQAFRLSLASPRCAGNVLRDSLFGLLDTPYPRRILPYLTDSCNFACSMCCVGEARAQRLNITNKMMPFPLLEKAVNESRRFGPMVDFTLGGESTLYAQIWDAVKLVSENKMLSYLTTNGLLLERQAEELVASGLNVLLISLDGWDEESQFQRGRVNSFDAIIRGIREVMRVKGRKAFPIIRISTVITKVTYLHLERILDLVHSLGLREWFLSNYMFVTPVAQAAHRQFKLETRIGGESMIGTQIPDAYFKPDQVQDLKRVLAAVGEKGSRLGVKVTYAWDTDLDQYYSPKPPSRQSYCNLPYTRLDIHADGRMTLCIDGYTIGNLNTDSIAGTWNNERRRHFRTVFERDGILPMCFRCCGIVQNSIKF
jgi:MoaA/NifB/PqqE/SkfB family radical SAM enzyme